MRFLIKRLDTVIRVAENPTVIDLINRRANPIEDLSERGDCFCSIAGLILGAFVRKRIDWSDRGSTSNSLRETNYMTTEHRLYCRGRMRPYAMLPKLGPSYIQNVGYIFKQ